MGIRPNLLRNLGTHQLLAGETSPIVKRISLFVIPVASQIACTVDVVMCFH